jgi:hypothetical protein
MDQSPSWEDNNHSASQEIPHLLWNAKVHDHVHKSPYSLPTYSSKLNATKEIPAWEPLLCSDIVIVCKYYKGAYGKDSMLPQVSKTNIASLGNMKW